MLIAQLKKETNIAEYILYMWQIEDIIRSYQFDIDKIEINIVDKYPQDAATKKEIKAWYVSLIDIMKKEGLEEKGHADFIIEDIKGLGILHQTLLTTIQDKTYQSYYDEAKPNIALLMQKSNGQFTNEIEAALNGLYGLMMLRLKGEMITDATKSSLESISKLLAHLVQQYNLLKVGKLNLTAEQKN